jgi:hypothetical protein
MTQQNLLDPQGKEYQANSYTEAVASQDEWLSNFFAPLWPTSGLGR